MSSETMSIANAGHSDTQIISEIISYYEKGADVLFSRSHTGEAKIKIKHGPFKLLTTRYVVNDKIAVAIRENMRARIKRN